MATQSRSADSDVTCPSVRDDLEKHPGSFDFFQAVRLLQQWAPEPDAVAFHANPRLAFPTSQIESLVFCDDGRAHLTANFLGLVGPIGALPYFYSELINDRVRAKDSSLCAFFDIFHHRLFTLFYEAWQKHRFPVGWEHGELDAVSSALTSLLGIHSADLKDRQNVSDQVLLFYTGLFSIQSRPAAALEQILGDHFRLPVAIEQFQGAWCLLPKTQQCRLGSEGDFEQLGMGAILGDAVWNQQSRVRVRLGPMPLLRYRDFLPGAEGYQQVEALVEFFTNRQYDLELQLVLQREHVPDFALGAELPLGWCSWLKTEDFGHHPDDAVLPMGQQLCM